MKKPLLQEIGPWIIEENSICRIRVGADGTMAILLAWHRTPRCNGGKMEVHPHAGIVLVAVVPHGM